MQAAFAQNVRGHGRGGGLSMHSSNDDAAFPAHNGGKRLGPARLGFVRLTCTRQNRVVHLYGRGKNYQLGLARIFGTVLWMKLQAQTLQSIRFLRANFIRTCDLVAEFQQQRGQPAHPASGYTDEMNSVSLVREKFREIYVS